MKSYVLAAALLLGVSACGHMSRQELLYSQSGSFHNDVRWKRVNEASIRVVPWKQGAFLDSYRDKLETLQIEDYELESVRFPGPADAGYAEEPTLATLYLKRYQYEMPDVTRHKVTLEEKWLYNGDAWFIYEGWDPSEK